MGQGSKLVPHFGIERQKYMKLQNLTIIFIIIIIPVILLVSLYITNGIKTVKYQSLYDTGLLTAAHDAINAFELNTTNNIYSDNAETKRNILKSSVKMFEKSLCNTCGISSYNTSAIEQYIPAIVFGMHDGFYMYAPSYNSNTQKYEHNLKNYVYYSEKLEDGTVIRYSLDNYVVISGKFNGEYEIRAGYLIDLNGSTSDGTKYKGINIDTTDNDAINYYKEAYYFTSNLLNQSDWKVPDYLIPSETNDPENENSAFSQHKRTIIKNKIENVLNSSITAYSKRTFGKNYKMPKLSEEDWQKVYSNISMISFFQGKNIGLTKYSGYCVLNSTNSNEYVNSNLMYFIGEESKTYHDIRCTQKGENLKGYKVGDFKKVKKERSVTVETKDGKEEKTTEYYYEYNHKELACYNCINGSLNTNQTVYDYINSSNVSDKIKTAYWTSLARERHTTAKILDTQCVITYNLTGLTHSQSAEVVRYGDSFETQLSPRSSLNYRRPKEITIIMNGKILTNGYTYNEYNGMIEISEVTGDVIIVASSVKDTSNIAFDTAQEVTIGEKIEANIDQKQRLRIFKFIPTETGMYRFYSDDPNATAGDTDPYAYIYDGSVDGNTIDNLNAMAIQYANSSPTSAGDIELFDTLPIQCYQQDDDSGNWYNFKIECNCKAGITYFLVIRTYSTDETQKFTNIYIQKIK